MNPCFFRKWGFPDRSPVNPDQTCAVAIFARSQDRGHPDTDLVFFSDADHVLQSFRSDGSVVLRGEAAGDYWAPQGIAIFRNWIFVTSSYNGIQMYDVNGTLLRQWGADYGDDDGQFSCAIGVAVLARSQDQILARSKDRGLQEHPTQKHPTQDLVYVADFGNHRVQVFEPDGTFVRKWGAPGSGDGQFRYPFGVAVLARSQDRGHHTRDLIFVSEHGNHRIQAFHSDGTFLFKWGCKGSENGNFNFPSHLALHPIRDLLFVVDSGNHRVQVFDLDGVFITKWGSEGQADGEFYEPHGISVHPTNDMVYVSDEYRIQAFSLFQKGRKRKRTPDI